MVDNYTDRRIETDADGLRIKQYYIPVGDKRFRWEAIRSVGRVKLGTLRGSLRFWGTANPRYWANLDLSRPRKQDRFVLDLGRGVRPFITPDDPAALEAALRAHRRADRRSRLVHLATARDGVRGQSRGTPIVCNLLAAVSVVRP